MKHNLKWNNKLSCQNNAAAPGCKENHFYSLPFGQAEANINFTSPEVISTRPKSFLKSRIDFTVLLLFDFLKKDHLLIGHVNNRIY